MAECLFCRIVDREIPSAKVFEDDVVYAFEDINPQAPLHVLVIPKKHIATLNDLESDDNETVGHMHRVAAKISRDRGFDQRGYRTVFNVNRDGGQVVFHIHLHVLAGRRFSWPPG